MPQAVTSVENFSKSNRLGQIGTGTMTNDLKVWAARVRGNPNPMLIIGQADRCNMDGETLWALKGMTFRYSFLGAGSVHPLDLLYSFGFMVVIVIIGSVVFNRVATFMDTV